MIKSFHHILPLRQKNDLRRVVLPGSDAGDYDAVSETWFGCNIPWLQPRCISISSNLDKAVADTCGHPSAWLNPIDTAAACG